MSSECFFFKYNLTNFILWIVFNETKFLYFIPTIRKYFNLKVVVFKKKNKKSALALELKALAL